MSHTRCNQEKNKSNDSNTWFWNFKNYIKPLIDKSFRSNKTLLILSTQPEIMLKSFHCHTGTWTGWVFQTSCNITLWSDEKSKLSNLIFNIAKKMEQLCQRTGNTMDLLVICGWGDWWNVMSPCLWENSRLPVSLDLPVLVVKI
jgi:hypothetical protein